MDHAFCRVLEAETRRQYGVKLKDLCAYEMGGFNRQFAVSRRIDGRWSVIAEPTACCGWDARAKALEASQR